MKVAIIGSRTFNDFDRLTEEMKKIKFKVSTVISGGADGTDSLAEKWAKTNKIATEIYLPDWAKFGKRAGFIRNRDIINNSDACIAFWDGKSKGTQNSIELAKRKNIPITLIII